MLVLLLKHPVIPIALILSECNDFLSPHGYQPFTSHLNKLLAILKTSLIQTEDWWEPLVVACKSVFSMDNMHGETMEKSWRSRVPTTRRACPLCHTTSNSESLENLK